MSTIITNTLKGKNFWNEIKSDLDFFEVSKEESMQNKLSENNNSIDKSNIKLFWKKYSPDIPLEKIYDRVFNKKEIYCVKILEKVLKKLL